MYTPEGYFDFSPELWISSELEQKWVIWVLPWVVVGSILRSVEAARQVAKNKHHY
jgi:TRAP-type C4-dicarboxylate transport system permease small subunit